MYKVFSVSILTKSIFIVLIIPNPIIFPQTPHNLSTNSLSPHMFRLFCSAVHVKTDVLHHKVAVHFYYTQQHIYYTPDLSVFIFKNILNITNVLYKNVFNADTYSKLNHGYKYSRFKQYLTFNKTSTADKSDTIS